MKTSLPFHGPWKYERTSTARFVIRGTGVAGEIEIAVLKASSIPPVVEERARLIAAAPELLAALKALRAQGVLQSDDTSLGPYFEQAFKAIAKAEGGKV